MLQTTVLQKKHLRVLSESHHTHARCPEAKSSVAEGSFPLKRIDFKVGEGLWADTEMVADDVVVRIRMVLPPLA